MSPVPASVNDAKEVAARTRAEWLYAIANSVITPAEALRAAATREGAPLMNMSLRVLLSAAHPRKVVDEVVVSTGRVFGYHLEGAYVPVRWLYDSRSSSERLAALEEALAIRTSPPTRDGA